MRKSFLADGEEEESSRECRRCHLGVGRKGPAFARRVLTDHGSPSVPSAEAEETIYKTLKEERFELIANGFNNHRRRKRKDRHRTNFIPEGGNEAKKFPRAATPVHEKKPN